MFPMDKVENIDGGTFVVFLAHIGVSVELAES